MEFIYLDVLLFPAIIMMGLPQVHGLYIIFYIVSIEDLVSLNGPLCSKYRVGIWRPAYNNN